MTLATTRSAAPGGESIGRDSTSLLLDPPVATISAHDGYVRLTYSCLQQLQLQHLCSDTDAELVTYLATHAVHTSVAGFTEWQSATAPLISVGWDWYLDDQSTRLLVSPEPVRSNLMLCDRRGYDLGPGITSNLLRNWLASLDWQSAVAAALRPRVNLPCQF